MSDEGQRSSARDAYVRQGSDRHPSMKQAFACAFSGIAYAFKTQRNLKVHTVFAVLALILGFLLQISPASWLAVVLCIAAVFSLEVLNTALEAVVDLVSPEWHELAMHAKDCAAGAVAIFAVASLVVAAIVYLPPIIDLTASFLG